MRGLEVDLSKERTEKADLNKFIKELERAQEDKDYQLVQKGSGAAEL